MKIIDVNKTKLEGVIKQTCEILAAGGIFIFPTETCYGVGVDATNTDAVKRVLQYKRRPEGKPISVAVSDKEMARKYVEINDEAEEFYDRFLPGPYTVISKSKGKVAPGIESEKGTLGIRIPDHELILSIVEAYGKPFTSTSANSSGKKTPYELEDIWNNISQKQKEMVALALDAGKLDKNPPSTVIDTTTSNLQIIRAGAELPYKQKQEVTVNSAEDMQDLGEKYLGSRLHQLKNKALVILFNAPLGAGKTQYTKGIAKGLGITEIVKSPTYTLIEEYDFKEKGITGKLVHFDAWRIENMQEFERLELEKYLVPGNVLAIEWAGSTMEFFAQFYNHPQVDFVQIVMQYIDLDTRDVQIFS